jgi:hypothetical protein
VAWCVALQPAVITVASSAAVVYLKYFILLDPPGLLKLRSIACNSTAERLMKNSGWIRDVFLSGNQEDLSY